MCSSSGNDHAGVEYKPIPSGPQEKDEAVVILASLAKAPLYITNSTFLKCQRQS